MILNGIAAQSRTINTAIHTHIGIEAPATLAFFSPEVQFNAGVVFPINPTEGQVYFSPASHAVNASEESYSEDPVVYNGRQDFLFPITFQWNAQSGLEQEGYYSGFSAQNVQGVIPEAVGQDQKGYLTLSDRPIIAAMVNAIKALEAKNKALAAALEALMKRLEALEAAQ